MDDKNILKMVLRRLERNDAIGTSRNLEDSGHG